MIYLGVITKTRDHPTHPVRIEVDLGDGALELGWVMVAVAAWNTALLDGLKDAQVTVLDTGYTASDDKYRVLAIWPSLDLPLESNRKRVARLGDPVGIRGNPQITPVAAATILTGIPPVMPLGHDLVGVITDD